MDRPARVVACKEQDMTRQAKHKRRVLRLMLRITVARRRHEKIMVVLQRAGLSYGAALAEAYGRHI